MTVLKMLEKWAADLQKAGHNGYAVLSIPPALFYDAVAEADALAKYPSRLPCDLSFVRFGDAGVPTVMKFAGPAGYVFVKAEVKP